MHQVRNAIRNNWVKARSWFVRVDLVVLVLFLVVVTAGWMFLMVADAVTEGEHGLTDQWILRSLREPGNPAVPIGPRIVAEAARDITALGGYPVLTLLVRRS